MPTSITFLCISLFGGVAAGLFGLGGGIVSGLGVHLVYGRSRRLGWI